VGDKKQNSRFGPAQTAWGRGTNLASRKLLIDDFQGWNVKVIKLSFVKRYPWDDSQQLIIPAGLRAERCLRQLQAESSALLGNFKRTRIMRTASKSLIDNVSKSLRAEPSIA